MTDTLSPADATSGPTSLKDVIDAVPASCRERSTSRGLMLVARDLAIYGLVMTGLVLTNTWYLLIPLWLLAGLAVSGLFVLGHDAAHGSLTDNNKLNSFLGHVLFLPSLHIYESWVLGHNRIHHGHTVRGDMDFVWHPVTPEQYREMSRFQRARHRVEWSWLGSGAYYIREVWWEKMIRLAEPPRKWAAKIRRDRNIMYAATLVFGAAVAALGWFVSGGVAGAVWMVVKLMVVPFLLFSWSIGWTVYVHHIDPAIKWHQRQKWDKVSGQLDGTTVLQISKVLDTLFFHKIFVHMPHHVDQRIPCYHLEEAAEAIDQAFPGRVIKRRYRFRDYLRATKACKLYDFEAQQWVPYTAATDAGPDIVLDDAA